MPRTPKRQACFGTQRAFSSLTSLRHRICRSRFDCAGAVRAYRIQDEYPRASMIRVTFRVALISATHATATVQTVRHAKEAAPHELLSAPSRRHCPALLEGSGRPSPGHAELQ